MPVERTERLLGSAENGKFQIFYEREVRKTLNTSYRSQVDELLPLALLLTDTGTHGHGHGVTDHRGTHCWSPDYGVLSHHDDTLVDRRQLLSGLGHRLRRRGRLQLLH